MAEHYIAWVFSMRVFQLIKTTNMITEDFGIGFEKIWLYAKHDAGGCARYSGKDNCCP